MRHKHCDLIKAWAEGTDIEYKTETGRWLLATTPNWSIDTAYRIKQEPKPDYSVSFSITSGDHGVMVTCCAGADPKANLRLSFDGETHKIKGAVVTA